MEAAFFQHQHGVLGGSEWKSYATMMCGELYAVTGGQAGWDRHRSVLSPDFVSFIDGCATPAP
jgi:hypothetical protein